MSDEILEDDFWAEEPAPKPTKRALVPGKQRTTRAKRPRSAKGTTREGKKLLRPVLNTPETILELEQRKRIIIEGITEEKVAKATLPQLTVALGIIHDKLALLRGEPTQIISRDDRPVLNKLVRDLLEVSKARGIVIEADFVEVPPSE